MKSRRPRSSRVCRCASGSGKCQSVSSAAAPSVPRCFSISPTTSVAAFVVPMRASVRRASRAVCSSPDDMYVATISSCPGPAAATTRRRVRRTVGLRRSRSGTTAGASRAACCVNTWVTGRAREGSRSSKSTRGLARAGPSASITAPAVSFPSGSTRLKSAIHTARSAVQNAASAPSMTLVTSGRVSRRRAARSRYPATHCGSSFQRAVDSSSDRSANDRSRNRLTASGFGSRQSRCHRQVS